MYTRDIVKCLLRHGYTKTSLIQVLRRELGYKSYKDFFEKEGIRIPSSTQYAPLVYQSQEEYATIVRLVDALIRDAKAAYTKHHLGTKGNGVHHEPVIALHHFCYLVGNGSRQSLDDFRAEIVYEENVKGLLKREGYYMEGNDIRLTEGSEESTKFIIQENL